MLHRFLTLSQIPEIRTEPSSPEAGLTDVEIVLPVDVLWQLEELLKEFRFLKTSGYSTARLNNKLQQMIRPYMVNESDRIAFSRNKPAA